MNRRAFLGLLGGAAASFAVKPLSTLADNLTYPLFSAFDQGTKSDEELAEMTQALAEYVVRADDNSTYTGFYMERGNDAGSGECFSVETHLDGEQYQVTVYNFADGRPDTLEIIRRGTDENFLEITDQGLDGRFNEVLLTAGFEPSLRHSRTIQLSGQRESLSPDEAEFAQKLYEYCLQRLVIFYGLN